MLKRSFAESRAQIAAPETLTAITKERERLTELQQSPWPEGSMGTTREEIRDFHDVCMRLQFILKKLHVSHLLQFWHQSTVRACIDERHSPALTVYAHAI